MRLSTSIVNHVLSHIDFSLFDKIDFCAEFVEDEFFNSSHYLDLLDLGIEARHGISKLVFIPTDYNFVIKIPFRGAPDHYLQNNKNLPLKFEPFSNAVYAIASEYGYDYCRSEQEYYQLAKSVHLEHFFCETQYFTTINNIPIYISEQARPSDTLTKVSLKSMEIGHALDIAKEYNIIQFGNVYLLNALLHYYHPSEVKQLYNFLNDNDIGDLQNDNFGIRAIDNKPVIIDYSNFWS